MATSWTSPFSLRVLPQPCRRVGSLESASLTVCHQSRRLRGARSSCLTVRSIAIDDEPEVVTVPRSLPVRVAHELLLTGHRYLDVRTLDEFIVGHVVGAINVPYMFKVGSGLTKNPNFLDEVSSVFGKDDEIIVGCQSGRRSLIAAAELSSAGFSGVTDIAGGYSARVQTGLPTKQ